MLPAQAVIEALEDAGVPLADIAYVGSRRGVESRMMSDLASRGVQCAYLPISGLQRSLSLASLMSNVALLWRIPRSRLLASALCRRWSPRVVVSVGGYASQPMASAASAASIPVVCVSYDRIPGLATRRQARTAAVCAVAFVDSPLPRAVPTGAPVRRRMRELDVDAERDAARRARGIPESSIVVSVAGGSLGSGVLNAIVGPLAARLADADVPVAFYHVCGPRHLASPEPEIPGSVWYRRVGYEDDMAGLYAATDLLVCRAGASTVAEIATVGLAAVVVPWSGSAGAHQELNARWLAEHCGAMVLTDELLEDSGSRETALDRVAGLVLDGDERRRMASEARQAGSVHRSTALATVILGAAAVRQ